MARASRPSQTRRVEWRDGVHLAGTSLWCDSSVRRGACFVSSARVPGAGRHRQIIATDATAKLLASAMGRRVQSTLDVPFGRPFTLGSSRLELFPSGAAIGGASLAATTLGTRIVYAGAVRTHPGDLAGVAETRTCDVLVVDAGLATEYRFPPRAAIERSLHTWLEVALADHATPILVCEPLGSALDLVVLLGDDLPLRVHRAIAAVARAARSLGMAIPAVRPLVGEPSAGEVVLWPIRARGLAPARRHRVAPVTHWAADPSSPARAHSPDHAAGFPWQEGATREQLLAYVAETGAGEVFCVNGNEALIAALHARGFAACLLGPPRQLPLFR